MVSRKCIIESFRYFINEVAFKDKWERMEFLYEDVEELSVSLSDKYDSIIKISYGERYDSLDISFIEVPEEKSKLGVGSKIMKEICEYADKYGLQCILYANSNFGTDIDTLKGFYGKFGFKGVGFVKDVGYKMVRGKTR